MRTLSEALPSTILSQVNDSSLVISDKVQVIVTCHCGTNTTISTRALFRKWGKKDVYLCKSCSVKTYISDPIRVARFQESFAATAITENHRKKCSDAGKKVWTIPGMREHLIDKIVKDNKINPKKAVARDIARAALQNKTWFKEHMLKMRRDQMHSKTSVLEQTVAAVLDGLGISYERQFQFGYYSYDFYIPDHKLLLEVQGWYFHKDRVEKDSAKATYAVRGGYQVKHIWEDDFSSGGFLKTKLLELLNISQFQPCDFEFRDTSIREIDNYNARVFLGAYHYLPAISKSGYHVGCFLDDALIAVASYSSIVRNESAERLNLPPTSVRELSRFCIHPSRHKKNFASYFLTRSVKLFKNNHYKIKKLISFADTTQGHVGTIYRACNWTYDGQTKPDYIWLSPTGHYAHKKTIWDRAKKQGMTELEYSNLNGYVKIQSKPKNRFILNLE